MSPTSYRTAPPRVVYRKEYTRQLSLCQAFDVFSVEIPQQALPKRKPTVEMETTTLITLDWELHTQGLSEGLSKSRIAERLGKDRGAIRLWIEAVTEKGLLPFLEQHQKAKNSPARQIRLATKQLIWAIREREHGCCGQKIACFLEQKHQISLAVPKIYEVLAEKYTLRSK